MIYTLYEPFRHWSEGGSIYILSDLHFDDFDCRLMDPTWITPQEQIAIINKTDLENFSNYAIALISKACEDILKLDITPKPLVLGSDDPCKNCKHFALCRFDENFKNYKRLPIAKIDESSFETDEESK